MTPTGSPVAVTGIGVVSPAGTGAEDLWCALRTGGTRSEPVRHFDTAGARVQRANIIPGEQSRQGAADRTLELLLRSCRQAMSDSGTSPDTGVGLIVASTENSGRVRRTADRSDPGEWPGLSTSMVGGAAFALGLDGPRFLVSSASASGGLAVGLAREMINAGEIRAALVVGAESVVETAFMGLDALRILSRDGCRPFAKGRTGITASEAACALFLEPVDRVMDGRAKIHARIVGYGCSNHSSSLTASDTAGITRSISRALDDAGLTPDNIDFVNAHGTGTRQGDDAEVAALRDVFGDRLGQVAIVGSKGVLGHCQGAAGIIEALATILSLVHRRLPVSHRSDPVDTRWPDLDVVLAEREAPDIEFGLSVSCGLGGVHTALVIGRAEAPS